MVSPQFVGQCQKWLEAASDFPSESWNGNGKDLKDKWKRFGKLKLKDSRKKLQIFERDMGKLGKRNRKDLKQKLEICERDIGKS